MATVDDEFYEALNTRFVTVTEKDWSLIDSLLDESTPMPKISDSDNVGKHYKEIFDQLGFKKDCEEGVAKSFVEEKLWFKM